MRILIALLVPFLLANYTAYEEEHPTLPIGAKAPAFSLK